MNLYKLRVLTLFYLSNLKRGSSQEIYLLLITMFINLEHIVSTSTSTR